MNKIMKGYGVGSILERTSYSKSLMGKARNSSRAILELDIYRKNQDTKKRLCQLTRKREL